jgi:hypothetical protein
MKLIAKYFRRIVATGTSHVAFIASVEHGSPWSESLRRGERRPY